MDRCMYVCTGKCLRYPKNLSKAARVQWHPCTLPNGINGDVSLTYICTTIIFTRTNNPHPIQHKGSARTPGSLLLWWRKPKYSERTTGPLGGNRQTREISEDWSPGQSRDTLTNRGPQSTHSSLNSGLGTRDVCERVKITLLMYWYF